ncbi:hypothetical protein BN7_5324 [Wickerhamomyces ciferrii]|uniref:Lon protease homolog, mitochondrial n=1 Tax=Wickerhamomyces ciferrii (strain ATCC 14091 / BCRC 22168 / CBS 111 / JCM 3599 / NBRC 0793 / NRRL Y-1031 F-60-10) TaxID=1206466 RepID=K0KXE5_WICCF|nr:uncharacterized protein BN7_5324 [Wickerhamomyces ciferrii]CCH45738.1 hypothetical protein BN7_5324 [Wickerhamomyces ciferrii]
MLRSKSCLRPLLSVNQRITFNKTTKLSLRYASKVSYNDIVKDSHFMSKINPLSVRVNSQAPDMESINELLNEQLILKEDDKSKSNETNEEQDKSDKEQPSKKDEKPERKKKKRETPTSKQENNNNISEKSNESSATSAAGGSSSSSSGNDGENPDGSDDGNAKRKTIKVEYSPEIYPQVLAVPITQRPLFPGLYKAVRINDPQVIKAVNRLVDENKPYIGVFAFKKEDADSDLINNKDEIFSTGVFAQITSCHMVKDTYGNDGMTIVVYPHSRISVDEVIPKQALGEVITDETLDKEKLEKEVEQELIDEGKSLETQEVQSEKEERLIKKIDEESEYNPVEFLQEYEVSRVNVSLLKSEPFDKNSAVVNALSSEILRVFKDAAQYNHHIKEQLTVFSDRDGGSVYDNAGELADFAASLCVGKVDEIQEVLDELNIEKRLEKALTLLKREVLQVQLYDKIVKDVEAKITKKQQEYVLMEKLKQIKKELGMDDGRQKVIDTITERMKDYVIPESVQKIIDDEMTKLQTLEPHMSEFGVTRNYLDWISHVPFGNYTPETFNISDAKRILEEDHYGLKDVKDRILEFIAIAKLLGTVKGKIICFVGPPGVGKTSIGKSIARALNRNFFRISVGGLTDVSEIKGHRRTYVGAMPGRIIQALKKTHTMNPMILIDEIDKIGNHSGFNGDPSAALLELLDPEQNNEFLDQYMDFPIDLSKALFVCTANTLDTIPRPLLDRMEVIEIPGYVSEEKVEIAKNYLIPQAKNESGLGDANVTIADETVDNIVRQYAKENGVRRLKQLVEKVYRKAAFKAVTDFVEKTEGGNKTPEEEIKPNIDHREPKSDREAVKKEDIPVETVELPKDFALEITPTTLKDYIGPPIYTSDRLYETTPPGVIMGLAWTSIGGTSLYVESSSEPSEKGGELKVTGQLGDVMKESSNVSFAVAKKYVKNEFFKNHNIYVHCPEGAIPKDGPSAGITMTTALISLALNKPLPAIAMTGEITLTGKVLRIGGLKEKLIAAQRNGISRVYLPKNNENDFEDLDEKLKKDFNPLFVDNYSQIFEDLFKDVPNEAPVKADK